MSSLGPLDAISPAITAPLRLAKSAFTSGRRARKEAEKVARQQREQFNRLNAERAERDERARKAKAQAAISTRDVGTNRRSPRSGTILTSPLGQVSNGVAAQAKTLLGA